MNKNQESKKKTMFQIVFRIYLISILVSSPFIFLVIEGYRYLDDFLLVFTFNLIFMFLGPIFGLVGGIIKWKMFNKQSSVSRIDENENLTAIRRWTVLGSVSGAILAFICVIMLVYIASHAQ